MTWIVTKIFTFLISTFAKLIGYFIDLVVTLIPFSSLPDLTEYINAIHSFYQQLFSLFSWVCNALMLTKFDLKLIALSLTIKLTYKPVVALVKIFLKWFDTIKGIF